MSVVCCRINDGNIEIASDSISIRGYTQSKGHNIAVPKLTKHDDFVYGSVGFAEEHALFGHYLLTHKFADFTENELTKTMVSFANWKQKEIQKHDIENSYIFVKKSKAFSVSNFLISPILKFEAIGAGRDFALAALYLGHSAVESAKVACELSIFCEEPIHSFVL